MQMRGLGLFVAESSQMQLQMSVEEIAGLMLGSVLTNRGVRSETPGGTGVRVFQKKVGCKARYR